MTGPSAVHAPAYHLVMCSFDGRETAARVVARLKLERVLEGCEIEGEALVTRDASGRIHYHEKGSAGMGATVGATTMGIIGFVGGPVVLPIMVVAGALLGGVAGHFAGQVLPAEDLRRVAESLQPDHSAWLGLVDTAHADAVAGVFEGEKAEILNIPVEAELSAAIREAVTHTVVRV
jgi:uncharacterized membrane protein